MRKAFMIASAIVVAIGAYTMADTVVENVSGLKETFNFLMAAGGAWIGSRLGGAAFERTGISIGDKGGELVAGLLLGGGLLAGAVGGYQLSDEAGDLIDGTMEVIEDVVAEAPVRPLQQLTA